MSEKKKPSPPPQPPPPTEDEIKFGDELAVLPIRNAVLFPGAVAPFDVGREKSVALVEDVHNLSTPVIAIFEADPELKAQSRSKFERAIKVVRAGIDVHQHDGVRTPVLFLVGLSVIGAQHEQVHGRR